VNIRSSPAKVRKDLSADSLINMVRNNFKQSSDYRKGNTTISLCDALKVRNGHPVEEIIAESIASDYDVIVMGTHGHGILAGAMMGSTAMRVVRRSHVPVMGVRLQKTA